MYILAKLVFKNYVPLKLEQGMLFISKQTDTVYGKVYEYLQLHTLVYIPRDKDLYINENGFPVEPYIIAQNQNPDDKETVLDPCAGFGGRCVATILHNKLYFGFLTQNFFCLYLPN